MKATFSVPLGGLFYRFILYSNFMTIQEREDNSSTYLRDLQEIDPCLSSRRPASYKDRWWNISLWLSRSARLAIYKYSLIHMIFFYWTVSIHALYTCYSYSIIIPTNDSFLIIGIKTLLKLVDTNSLKRKMLVFQFWTWSLFSCKLDK